MKICDIARVYSPLSRGVKRYRSDRRQRIARVAGAQQVLIIPSHRDAVAREAATVTYEIRLPRLIASQSYRLLIGPVANASSKP